MVLDDDLFQTLKAVGGVNIEEFLPTAYSSDNARFVSSMDCTLSTPVLKFHVGNFADAFIASN